VRSATEADLAEVLRLFDALRNASPRAGSRLAGGGPAGPRAEVEQRYRNSLQDPDARLLVAVLDEADDGSPAGPAAEGGGERLVGMVLCTVSGSGTFIDAPVIHMNHFFVLPEARRRGAGRALLAAATAFAEERGVDGLGVAVYPDSREANRYFARLGFAPVYVHRVAPLASLRRMLGTAVPAGVREESVRGARRRLRVGGSGPRPIGRTRRYPV
jgi:GNAT superfamily N-acetyltransferase